MAKTISTPPKSGKQLGSNETEELSALNAQTLRKDRQSLRRKMEASIETKARKRRRREVPGSAAWKP